MDFGNEVNLGRKYIALDWAQRNLLEHVRLHPERGWDDFYEKYGSPILAALTFAFSRDILHRDVKPQNVLIDKYGVVRVADFGISKFKRYYRPGVTLVHLKTTPYTPEIESEEFADTRDVHGYAVLCLECLGPNSLNTYEDVYHSLDSALLPEEIEPIVRRALEREPHLRHHNVVELRDELATAMRRRVARNAVRRDIPVHITNSAAGVLKTEFHEVSQSAAIQRLLRELNEVCGMDLWPANALNEEAHLALLTAEFRFRAVIDDDRRALAIINAARARPSQLERQRDRAWLPHVRFTLATAAGDAKAMDWLRAELDVFLANRRVQEEARAETELFDRWAAILRVKADVEEQRKAPINFKDVQLDGHRLELSLQDRVVDDVVGEDRLIRVGDGSVIEGVIERVSENLLTLYCAEAPEFENLPRKGSLVADTRLADIAIKRQNFALDALRFGRAVRPELRDILIGKIPIREPKSQDCVKFFQDPLDDDKKASVALALGTPDLLLVQGPPGTGKTRFITELVAQFLREKPHARILLSSQTHNALDHALAGIEGLARREGLSHRLVRIARRGDPRVSSDLEHLLLENGVQNWLSEAVRRSDEFLRAWAKARNISTEYVRVGLALADLRFSNIRFRQAETNIAAREAVAVGLRQKETKLRDDPGAGDEYRRTLADLRLAEQEMEAAEEERGAARRALAAARRAAAAFPDLAGDLDSLTESDMEELELDFINHAPGGSELRKMLSLSEEWRQRFGRSTDFHGAFLAGCDVVAGTCIGVATQWLQRVEFDLCIIDEASKATPTEMLVPMTRAKKWVIVGDPKQLPPFLDAALSNKVALEQYGLSRDQIKRTLLDHLISVVPDHSQRSLLSQHRMIRPIGELVSNCFYDGILKNENDSRDEWLARAQALPRPVTWFTTSKLADRSETNRRNETKNFAEVRVIQRLLSRLQLAARSAKREYSVALLSGYAGQVRELQDMVSANRAAFDQLKIDCATVDGYQGREADVAVYSVTRSNAEGRIGFLKEHERLNVALSRPRVGLAIVGDSHFCETVTGQNPFADVLGYIRRNPNDCLILEEVE